MIFDPILRFQQMIARAFEARFAGPAAPKTFTCLGCKTGPWDIGWSGPRGAEDYRLCPNCSGAD